MTDLEIGRPIISNGEKWYPVMAWVQGEWCKQKCIFEYFKTVEEAEKWISEQ